MRVRFNHALFYLLQPSLKDKEKEDAKALGPDRVPENQKREVYERVRRAVEAKAGACIGHKVCYTRTGAAAVGDVTVCFLFCTRC